MSTLVFSILKFILSTLTVNAQPSKRKRALLVQVGVKRNRNRYGNTNWGLNGWYSK